MSLGVAAARRKLTPVQPDEFHDDFTTKSAATLSAGQQTFTSDSGHLYYATGTNTGGFRASPYDSTMVLTMSNGVTGALYLCASLGGIVYGWTRMRFTQQSQSTKNMAGGLIPWNNINPNANANSGAHCVITENELYFQQVDNGTTFTTVGGGSGTWGYTDPGQAWFEVEWAIYGNDLVVRLPDGTTETYNDSSLTDYLGNWLCVEPVRNSSTDWYTEFAEVKGSTLAGMSPAQLLYYNNLLATQGIGPAAQKPAPISGSPVLVATGGVTAGITGNGNPTFISLATGLTYTCTAGDRIFRIDYNDDTQTLNGAPSGYSTAATVQHAGAAGSLGIYTKTAAGGETATGVPTGSTTAPDTTIVLVFQSCGGVGGTNTQQGTVALRTIPAIASLTNSPAGKSRKLYAVGRRGAATTGAPSNLNIDAPYGFDVAKLQEGSVSGNGGVGGAYISQSNFTSDAAGLFSDSAGSQATVGIVLELLGV